jgi:hypothetical protein
MFTINWTYKIEDMQVHHIFAAERIDFAFRDCIPGAGQAPLPKEFMGRMVTKSLAVLEGYDLAGRSFDCGTVYVMNEHGKTVAHYELGDPPASLAAALPEMVTIAQWAIA